MSYHKEMRKYMLSRKEIAEQKNIRHNSCQGCGFDTKIHRCHIKSCVNGGGNEADNMLLLCPFCHAHIQEAFTFDDQDIEFIKNLFIEQHMPFFNVKANHYISKFNNGLLPRKFMDKLSAENESVNIQLPYFNNVNK